MSKPTSCHAAIWCFMETGQAGHFFNVQCLTKRGRKNTTLALTPGNWYFYIANTKITVSTAESKINCDTNTMSKLPSCLLVCVGLKCLIGEVVRAPFGLAWMGSLLSTRFCSQLQEQHSDDIVQRSIFFKTQFADVWQENVGLENKGQSFPSLISCQHCNTGWPDFKHLGFAYSCCSLHSGAGDFNSLDARQSSNS